MARMRLDKLLSALAVCPRSGVTALLRAGRVRVDGAAARDAGMAVDPDVQIVTLDDQALEWKAQRTVMLNKPCGVLTAARDPKQPTVLDLLPPLYRAMNCMPAGRLDKDTGGLLILTTDGQLAHRLISPKREVGKLYEAEVDGPLCADDVAAFAGGLSIRDADGAFQAKPAELTILSCGEAESTARVRVTEGKYHQVRRMFAARGRTVTALRRLAIGSLYLDESLQPGQWRELSPQEIRMLEQAPAEPEARRESPAEK